MKLKLLTRYWSSFHLLFFQAGVLFVGLLVSLATSAQEIEARAYSNAPIGMNFITGGLAQAKSGSYILNTQALSLTHVIDVAGQSGRLTMVLPYSELSGTGQIGAQSINASAEGLSDPLIKASVNLYGAPALTNSEFANYRQDLIIGASIAASIPWGQYNSNQMINVGANRSLIQPAMGVSQAVGPWRLELAGMATIYTSNNNFMGNNTLSQNPIYSGETHVIYYFPNTAWISADATYFTGGQTYVNGLPASGTQENWRFGSTLSYPIDKNNSIRLSGSKGVYSRTDTSYNAVGISWQYRWGGTP
ncbi:transporter [Polynucleobacter sp. MWH-UH25E]|uniref:transporter n=1 Tax=Polynucleobacter sp. MWH-UH25E TaxID=1855616 RepID=UPI001BFE8EB2|nr:transporter [Polynucleobacter sp. MWH-UH25E]QWD61613.1 transporter [Polynucleobacter sp. MWH-UH25E]